ncbi:hypothetical protein J3459_006335, partial [Metarhizium acridum]
RTTYRYPNQINRRHCQILQARSTLSIASKKPVQILDSRHGPSRTSDPAPIHCHLPPVPASKHAHTSLRLVEIHGASRRIHHGKPLIRVHEVIHPSRQEGVGSEIAQKGQYKCTTYRTQVMAVLKKNKLPCHVCTVSQHSSSLSLHQV